MGCSSSTEVAHDLDVGSGVTASGTTDENARSVTFSVHSSQGSKPPSVGSPRLTPSSFASKPKMKLLLDGSGESVHDYVSGATAPSCMSPGTRAASSEDEWQSATLANERHDSNCSSADTPIGTPSA